MSLDVKFDITKILNKLDGDSEVVVNEAWTFLEQVTEVGAEAARTALDLAETEYGKYRINVLGKGNSTGRNDEGTMINALKAQELEIVEEYSAEVVVGWSEEDYQEYFGYQEEGTARIGAAHSLRDGLEQMEAQTPRLLKNMKDRIRRKMK